MSRGRPRAVVAGFAAVALALAVALVARRPPSTPTPAPPRVDPFATMHPESVYTTAVLLMTLDRDAESLPWFRASLARVREDFWELHFNYYAALRNTALEDTVRLGIRAPLERSSLERVVMMREALHELDRAEALAPTADVAARIRIQRARTLRVWGAAWDAWLQFRLASETVSHRKLEEFLADDFTDLMRNPTRPPKPHEERD